MADRMECSEIGLSNDGAVSLFYFLSKQSDRKTELFNHKNITGLTQKLARKPTTVSSAAHVAETGPASEFKYEG
ncbi:hypothetical protein OFN24_31985, partial [Escherichia coli]|nr:hypothetical protein [Escherichia coli]